MFILLAHNTTGTKPDGISDYDVEIRINERTIAHFSLQGHVREQGWIELVRKIANKAEAVKE